MRQRDFVTVFVVVLLGVGSGCYLQRGHMVKEPVPDPDSLAYARRIDRIAHHIRLGDYPRAQTALDRLLAEGYEHPRALYLKGLVLLRSGGRDGATAAIPFLERAVEASPTWFEPRSALAQAYMALERLGAADAIFAEVDRLHGEHPAGPYGRGVVALRAGDTARANEFFDQALKRDPTYAPALRSRAYTAELEADEATRRRMLERYLVERPRDPEVHYQLGGVYEAQGRLADARRAFERAYQLRPAPYVAQRLATLARRRDDERAALEWDRRSGASTPRLDSDDDAQQ